MAVSWWFRRAERRRQEMEKRLPALRAPAFDVVRDLAAPLVEQGVARLEWREPEHPALDPEVELTPANEAAAPVIVSPGPGLVTLLVGPSGYSHELVPDRDGDWQHELRACLEAVVDGRYRESASRGFISREVLTMTFEMLDRRDVVVKHFDMTDADPPESGSLGERSFAAYAQPAAPTKPG
jgi:hypothetical protein